MYCYLSLDVSLQSMFDRPNFCNDCEKWRHRSVASGLLQDVYDGQIWHKFMCYEGKPFLCEPGKLGLILNFDFFQPSEHLLYPLSDMSVLNLPRECRFKQENTILVGLIPSPHEPSHNVPWYQYLSEASCRWSFQILGWCTNDLLTVLKMMKCALMCFVWSSHG